MALRAVSEASPNENGAATADCFVADQLPAPRVSHRVGWGAPRSVRETCSHRSTRTPESCRAVSSNGRGQRLGGHPESVILELASHPCGTEKYFGSRARWLKPSGVRGPRITPAHSLRTIRGRADPDGLILRAFCRRVIPSALQSRGKLAGPLQSRKFRSHPLHSHHVFGGHGFP